MKRFHRLPLAVVAALCAIGVAAPALAQTSGTLKKIQDTGSITIGHRESSIPFSYLDDKQQPVGYAMDLCAKVVDAVKAQLKMPNLKVAYQPVTSANRRNSATSRSKPGEPMIVKVLTMWSTKPARSSGGTLIRALAVRHRGCPDDRAPVLPMIETSELIRSGCAAASVARSRRALVTPC